MVRFRASEMESPDTARHKIAVGIRPLMGLADDRSLFVAAAR